MGVEKTLEKKILDFLKDRGVPAWKIHSGGAPRDFGGKTYWLRLAEEGTPDVFACVGGIFLAIEVKRDAEEHGAWERQWERYQATKIKVKSSQRSIAQHEAHERIIAAGGMVIVTSDFEEFQRQLLNVEAIARKTVQA